VAGVVAVALACAACGGDGDPDPAAPARARTTATTTVEDVDPAAYLATVADTIEAHAFYADRADLRSFRASIPTLVARAHRPSQTYDAVRRLLAGFDPHALLTPPAAAPGRTRPPARLPEDERPTATVADGVGLLALPLARWDPADRLGADYVARAWRGLGEDACGWVVDMRGPGGDVFTLLMALAPLLEPGRALGFAGREGTATWSLAADGSLTSTGTDPPVASPDGARPPGGRAQLPVAIVQGPETASAHELAILAFAGRPATRRFGAATAGVPTALRGFTLADGSVLRLTTALGVDRAGRTHDGPLPPDAEVEAPEAIAAARAWVAAQPPCRRR
jgi:hypothetical protein